MITERSPYAQNNPYAGQQFNESTGQYTSGQAQPIQPPSQGTPYRPEVSVYNPGGFGSMDYTPTTKTMNAGAKARIDRSNKEVDIRRQQWSEQASDRAYRQQLSQRLQAAGRTPEAISAYRQGMQNLGMYQKTRHLDPKYNNVSVPTGYQNIAYPG